MLLEQRCPQGSSDRQQPQRDNVGLAYQMTDAYSSCLCGMLPALALLFGPYLESTQHHLLEPGQWDGTIRLGYRKCSHAHLC
jgi:hypothetical protein